MGMDGFIGLPVNTARKHFLLACIAFIFVQFKIRLHNGFPKLGSA
jgi:hypothetical protein